MRGNGKLIRRTWRNGSVVSKIHICTSDVPHYQRTSSLVYVRLLFGLREFGFLRSSESE
jgi:hypothetical protein